MGDFTSGVLLCAILALTFWSVRNRIGVVNIIIYPYIEYVLKENDDVFAVRKTSRREAHYHTAA